jgi:hypothetical protein
MGADARVVTMAVKTRLTDELVRLEVRVRPEVAEAVDLIAFELSMARGTALKYLVTMGVCGLKDLMGQKQAIAWQKLAERLQKSAREFAKKAK